MFVELVISGCQIHTTDETPVPCGVDGEETGTSWGLERWLRALAALAEVLSSISSVHTVAHNRLLCDLLSSSGVSEKTALIHKINKSLKTRQKHRETETQRQRGIHIHTQRDIENSEVRPSVQMMVLLQCGNKERPPVGH